MTNAQKTILFLGLVTIIALSLRPPYQLEHATYLINRDSNVPHKAGANTINAGHRWIWSPPQGRTARRYTPDGYSMVSYTPTLDWLRLGIYVGLAALLTLFTAFVIFSNRKEGLK